MVVRDRRARRRRARLGLPDHLLSRRDRRRRRRREPLRGAPAAVRARRRHRPRGATAAPRPAHRAQRLRHRRGRASATPRSSLRDWRLGAQRRRRREPLRARAPRATAPASPSTSSSTRRSRSLLQGDGGVSRKGPRAEQTSRYYSEPQLAVRGTLAIEGRPVAVTGRAWLDHEWSDAYLDPGAVGWDWIGMNLDDGGALMAFRMRRADGSTLWSGGSHRAAGGATRDFADGEVVFTPGRTLDQPGVVGALSGRVARRDAGRPLRRARAARRPGARQPRQHRRDLLGRPVAARRRERRARRPRLPRDDRLRRAASCSDDAAPSAAGSVRAAGVDGDVLRRLGQPDEHEQQRRTATPDRKNRSFDGERVGLLVDQAVDRRQRLARRRSRSRRAGPAPPSPRCCRC